MALRILRAGGLVASGFVAAVLLLLGHQVALRPGEDDRGYPDDFSWELEGARVLVLESRRAELDDLVAADIDEARRILSEEFERIGVERPERRSLLQRAWETVKNDARIADPDGDAIH